jgi:hypothetical protein
MGKAAKLKLIKPISRGNLKGEKWLEDKDWATAFDSIQSPVVCLNSTDEAVEKASSITTTYWVLALHWVYKKKWNPKHKIPCKRDAAKKLEPLGNLFLSILNLCEALHTIGYGQEYSNAGQWFTAVLLETKNEALANFLGLTNENSLDASIKSIRKDLSYYRNGHNPHDKNKNINTWRLIEAALKVTGSNKYPQIANELWRGVRAKENPGFLHAYSAWAAALESKNYQKMTLKNGKLVSLVKKEKGKPVFKEVSHPKVSKIDLWNPYSVRCTDFSLEKIRSLESVVQMTEVKE